MSNANITDRHGFSSPPLKDSHSRIENTFEYLAEQAKLNFQNQLGALLEMSQRIDDSTRQELLRIICNLGSSYDILDETNRRLHINYRAIEHLYSNIKTRSLKTAIEDFSTGKASKEDLQSAIQKFTNLNQRAA